MTQPLFLILTRRAKPNAMKRYFVTFLIVVIISFIRYFVNVALGENVSYIIFTFAVVISAWYGGMSAGLFATILCVVSGMFFSFTQGSAIGFMTGSDQFRVGIFVLQGIIISVLLETVQEATRWQSIILESISDVFITYDRNMRFMYVNKKAEEMLQLSRRDLLGRKLVELYPEAKKTVFYKNCMEALRKQKTMAFELYITEDDTWYDVNLYPSFDGVSASYQNITKRKRVEKRLRESQLQFKRFVDANIIGVVVADLEGRIYEANDFFLRMIGYTRSDLREGKINWKTITPAEYLSLSEKTNRQVLRRGVAEAFVKDYIRKDGTRVHLMMGKILLNKNSRKVIVFCIDISERVELESKKNEFISIASHELKTPLTTIKAFTQILLKQVNRENDKRASYFLTNIDTQINRLNLLIGDLLDVSKIEAGKLPLNKSTFQLDELVKKVIVDFQYTTQTHTILKEGKSISTVFGDAHRLEQVLINLISNAVKYSPKADRVIVTVKDEKRRIVVSVQDYGIGITSEEQKKVFDRFFRSEKHMSTDVTGFGLGLFITKEIVDRHKGKIWVESTEGKGSTFYFSIPIHQEAKNKR